MISDLLFRLRAMLRRGAMEREDQDRGIDHEVQPRGESRRQLSPRKHRSQGSSGVRIYAKRIASHTAAHITEIGNFVRYFVMGFGRGPFYCRRSGTRHGRCAP